MSIIRTIADLDRCGRALSTHFKTDAVVIVGSQSVLVAWPDAPVLMRSSSEIDAFPSNAREWENDLKDFIEASEEINGLFGIGSPFHSTHGFHIDGCDITSARMPCDWAKRAVYREISSYGQQITLVAPSVDDMIVSKLIRLVEKDKSWLSSCNDHRGINKTDVLATLSSMNKPSEIVQRADTFLKSLPDNLYMVPSFKYELPDFPVDTHHCFFSLDRKNVTIRKWDENKNIYLKVDNPLDYALAGYDGYKFVLDGRIVERSEWENAPVSPPSLRL